MKPHLHFTQNEKDEVLKNFMLEFFDFKGLCDAGVFTKEMKHDYKAQAKAICDKFGFKTVYEWGLTAKHTSSNNGFSWTIESIYE
jgi:hypothetical protein